MSTALNCGLPGMQPVAATAASALRDNKAVRLCMALSEEKVVVHQQRREQHAQVDQGEAESLARERVRVFTPQAKAIPGKAHAQHESGGQVQPRAPAVGKG